MASQELIETIVRYEDEDYMRAFMSDNCRFSMEELALSTSHFHKQHLSMWPTRLLASYLDDLLRAKHEGRSLTLERTELIFGDSHPGGVRDMFVARPFEYYGLIDYSVRIFLVWEAQARAKYQTVTANLIPMIEEEDTYGKPSFETLLRSLLLTFSPKTISIYAAIVSSWWAERKNIMIDIYGKACYDRGWRGIGDAEDAGLTL